MARVDLITAWLSLVAYTSVTCRQALPSWSRTISDTSQRSFAIDYENNTFVKDGAPFRYVSGSIHYFRVPAEAWRDRLRKMKYGGLNAVQTYVDWAGHEPEPGVFDFSGMRNISSFIRTAQEEGLLVILRVGPYMCAERDMGGLPYWLMRINPGIKLRSSDPSYVGRVDSFLLRGLFPQVKPLLYENGGPIIMVQLENEYGNYYSCDYKFTSHLRTVFRTGLGHTVTLFTTDNGTPATLKCGKIPGVYATVDFGSDADIWSEFGSQRLFEPEGPLVVSEFYSGWLDHWGVQRHKVDAKKLGRSLNRLLSIGANVNMYMYHGGTNFELTGGANYQAGKYLSIITTYDYDAPLSEAGDMTSKYYELKEVIGKHFHIPEMNPVPSNSSKAHYGAVTMTQIGSMVELASLLGSAPSGEGPVVSPDPKTFEELSVRAGMVVYITLIDFSCSDPCVINFGALHDIGYVYVNQQYKVTISRATGLSNAALRLKKGDTLTVVVESLGRISAGTFINDFKGLTSEVRVGRRALKNWVMIPLPLADRTFMKAAMHKLMVLHNIKLKENSLHRTWSELVVGRELPLSSKNLTNCDGSCEKRLDTIFFYRGTLTVPEGEDEPRDTFISLQHWSKGVVWMNGFCLGRYWPAMGPQVTLYVPRSALRVGENEVRLMETGGVVPCRGGAPCVEFVDAPDIDGAVPQY